MKHSKTLFIGVDGEQAVDSKKTLEQILAVEALECGLEHEGNKITWKDFNNPDEPRSLFQSILRDRKTRIDEHTLMADRPPFIVITAVDGKVVRFEFYEGHDALELVYDLRSKELQGKALPKYLESDPQAYDPAKFIEEFLGMPEEITKPLLDEIHKTEEKHG